MPDPPDSILATKDAQDAVISTLSEGRDVFAVLKQLGVSFADVVKAKRKDKEFANRLDDAHEAFAENLFFRLVEDFDAIDEDNAAAKKARLEHGKYLLKILNPLKFTDRQEINVKHQQVTPVVHLTIREDKTLNVNLPSTPIAIDCPQDDET